MNFPAVCDILYIKERHLRQQMPSSEFPTPKWILPDLALLLRALPILWARQDRHFYFFLLFLLSRKVRNATTRLPKEISKPIIPINIKMISAAVILRTSLPMYSGKPVIKLGRLPPCHGYFPYFGFYHNLTKISTSAELWVRKVST